MTGVRTLAAKTLSQNRLVGTVRYVVILAFSSGRVRDRPVISW